MKQKSNDDSEESTEDNLPNPGLSSMLDVSDEKSELDKIFEQMMDPANIHHNTEVSQEEINGFSTLHAMSKNFRDKGYPLVALESWLLEQLKLRVSKGRQGRKEWVKITTKMQDGPQKTGFFDRFGGFRGGRE